MWTRLLALVVKELLATFRDPRGRMILIGPPILQLFIFSYAATLDVKNVSVALLNEDHGPASIELIQRLAGSPTFRRIVPVTSAAELEEAIDAQRAIAAIRISRTYSRDLAAGGTGEVQLLLDGRRSNASQIVQAYIGEIAQGLAADYGATASAVDLRTRAWFNPNLVYLWFTLPCLIGIIAMLMALTVTGLSIARERELGTYDQLMVSPLRVHEILLGKTVPSLLVGLFHATLYMLAAVFLFGVPFTGSLLSFYASLVVYLLAVIGVGLFFSSVAQTQQQAFLGSFLFGAPAILLSGFAAPVENMPEWLQTLSLVNPLRHFLVIVKGVFLKDMPPEVVLANTVPLILIAAVTLSVAAWFFRQRME